MAELSELLLARELLVEREVQPEDVNPWLSEQPKIGTFGRLSDRLVHLIHGNASRLGHSRRLHCGIRRTDVRIQARRRGCYGIRWDRGFRGEDQWILIVVKSLNQFQVIDFALRIPELIQWRR